MRYRRVRRDANHREIVQALHEAGATVLDLAAVGGGAPDLLVGYSGSNVLLEVKNPERKGGRNNNARTVEKQTEFRAAWRGPVYVVESIAAALAAIGVLVVGGQR